MDDFHKKFFRRAAISLGIALAVVILNLVMSSDLAKRETIIRDLRKDTAFKQQAFQSFLSLKQESDRADKYAEILSGILPPQDELINFPKDIKNLALRNKLEPGGPQLGIQNAGTTEEPGYIGFKMLASGGFANFINFLEDLEASPYIVSFDSLELTGSQKGERAEVKIQGKVYSR